MEEENEAITQKTVTVVQARAVTVNWWGVAGSLLCFEWFSDGCERKRVVKDDSQVCGLSNQKAAVAVNGDRETG